MNALSSPEPEPRVARATWDDVPQLSGMLARAFDADPLYQWLVPRGAQRAQRLVAMFELFLRQMSHELNETFTVGGAEGCALWKRPGQHRYPFYRQLLWLPAYVHSLGLKRMPGALKLLQTMEEAHERLAPEPHFYLFLLGVEPERQGRGLGALALTPTLQQCDREARPAFLETAQPSNVPFYERRGFRTRQKLESTDFPTLWFMTRDPR
jgi:GNAT superfamily N-acetyltransferase